METTESCRAAYQEAIDSLESRIDTLKAERKTRLELLFRLGGVCSVYEAAEILGVSRQRVGVLIARCRFRTDRGLLSLADVNEFKRGPRAAGRPRATK